MWHGPPAAPELPASLPIFPLPGVVFFPGTVVPLHIFEPRYRRMVRDVLAGNGVLALALLRSGQEELAEGPPPIHPIGCAGRLLEVAQLPDGKFNIKLAGLARVELDEITSDKPYREARVKVLPERLPADGEAVRLAQRELVGAYALMVAEVTGRAALGLEGARAAPFHALVNTLCAHLDLPPALKQELLGLDDVLERGRAMTSVLQRELERMSRKGSGFEGKGPTIH